MRWFRKAKEWSTSHQNVEAVTTRTLKSLFTCDGSSGFVLAGDSDWMEGYGR